VKIEGEPRPTHTAFKPAGREDLKSDLILAGGCLAGFLLGLLVNYLGDFWDFMSTSERSANNTLTPIWLQLLIYFGYPLFLIGMVYFLWHAWNWRKKTAHFYKHRVTGDALLTHLWKEPPSGSGKKYFVGYRFNAEFSACQQIDARAFKSLQAGQTLPVEYLPPTPRSPASSSPRRGVKLHHNQNPCGPNRRSSQPSNPSARPARVKKTTARIVIGMKYDQGQS
jgi:hypothetical protein